MAFKCDKCGKKTQVKQTRQQDDGVFRRHICECGNKFSTVEVRAIREQWGVPLTAQHVNRNHDLLKTMETLTEEFLTKLKRIQP